MDVIRFNKAESDAERRLERHKDVAAAALELAISHGYGFVRRINRFFKIIDGEPIFLRLDSLRNSYPFWDREFQRAFILALEELGRIYDDVTYTFRKDISSALLNLMDMTKWIQPKPGDVDPAFGDLTKSLGCNKSENGNHLEHVLASKFAHPECHNLPCIMFCGEGNTGKNLLCDVILHRATAKQTISITLKHVIREFNPQVKGKTFVLINEAQAEKNDAEEMKNILHKPRLTINQKGIDAYEIDNTPLFMLASNSMEGGVFLDRSAADRRYSVMRAEKGKTLPYWIAQRTGMSTEAAQNWLWAEGDKIYGDVEQIARWKWYLLERYKNQPMPVALHGADYQIVMDVQKKMDERIIEAVFNDSNFIYIERRVLYEGYVLLCRARGNYPMSDTKFNNKVKDWIASHNLTVIMDDVTVGMKRRFCWRDSSKVLEHDTRPYYIAQTNFKDTWIGPDV